MLADFSKVFKKVETKQLLLKNLVSNTPFSAKLLTQT
jgi:hypothetical protein